MDAICDSRRDERSLAQLDDARGITAAVDDAIARRGLDRLPLAFGGLRVRAEERVSLPHDGLARGLEVTTMTSPRLADLKTWVGYLADDVRAGLCEATERRPARACPPGWRDAELLTDFMRPEVELAAHAYLFGDPADVASWVGLVERFFGPFDVRVIALDSLVVDAGATLTLEGAPLVLLVRHLVLHEGGTLCVRSYHHLAVDRFEKRYTTKGDRR